ncbi:MAG TPA: DedA family protein [Streptosporangiaceae bacterium]|nr:DedA family protein [Streptosporangiaceae bacterium]
MFNEFLRLVQDASGWAYAIVLALALLDALLPIVPSEASVITAGVVASTGGMILPLVIVAAALGAFLGDNTAYYLGYRFGPKARQRFFRGKKSQRTFDWAERQLQMRGGELIAVARFIPGGRTAVTLSAGTLHYPWRRFVVFDVIAAVIWGSYAALLGYFGGQAFEGAAWKGLLVALLTGCALTGVIEVVRWYLRRRGSRRGEPASPPAERGSPTSSRTPR